LNWRTGLSLPAAREKVRVARALPELPRISQAMGEGRLSYSKVRAITRVATPDNEEELLVFAEAGTAAHVERLVRAWRRTDRQAEIDDDERRHASRSLSAWVDEDGMVVVRGRLSPEVGAVLLRALEAAEERLFDLSKEASGDDTTGAQRRADALGLIAEAALAHDLDPGTRGDRYQVVVHVDASTLSASEADGQGQAALQDGQRVSAETSRRLACDASTIEMLHDSQGNILDIGRKTRAIPTPIRRALDHRDQGCCRFPGCEVTHCDAHHVEHWADGGETKLGNLVLLCRRHHRAVHEEGFGVTWEGGELQFYWPNGRRLEEAPRMPRFARPRRQRQR
ncbi:MAG: HNH endonuclease, partial [Phycisphaerales bacterium]|nr:HNH endonuclease [Phycisphaerales bacterium]